MKRVFVYIFSCLILTHVVSSSTKEGLERYEYQIARYNKLVSEAFLLRQRGADIFNFIKPRLEKLANLDKLDNWKVLTGEDIEIVHQYFIDSYQHFTAAQDFLNSLAINPNRDLVLHLINDKTHLKRRFSFFNWIQGKEPYYTEYWINPRDAQGIKLFTNAKMALGISVIMYDNFLVSLAPYYEKGALRRLINYDNVELRNSLNKMVDDFIDQQKADGVRQLYDFYKSSRQSEIPVGYEEDHQTLNWLIENSYSYQNYFDLAQRQDQIGNGRIFTRLSDFLLNTMDTSLNEVSRLFGFIVGAAAVRGQGDMLQLTSEQRRKITKQLRPLDILIERTNWHMSNLFIPGYFSHVAIWVGTEQELKDLGVWDELPAIEARARSLFKYSGDSFQQNIRNGRYIVEALRPGVQMNTFDHFLDIDEFAVFRANNISRDYIRTGLIKTLRQVGKGYDFNFDVETDDTIVCSELAYVVYGDYPWPTQSSWGRYTINPDHVATLGLNRNYFDLLMFYRGTILSDHPYDDVASRVKKSRKELSLKKALFVQ